MKLLCIFAHPDDEFSVAGFIQRFVNEGHEVHLVCATKGEAGRIKNLSYFKDKDMTITEIRTAEFDEACKLLGIHRYHFLNLKDNQSAHWNTVQVINDLTKLIDELKPTHVISFDFNGGNEHPDHKAVSRLSYVACINNPQIKYLQVTKFPISFVKKKFWWIPKKIKNKIIKKLSTSDDKVTEIYKLNKKELSKKIKLLKIYKSQFPDENKKYYKLPIKLLKILAKYECYYDVMEDERIK